MKNVIAFAGSNSKTSINKKLVSLAVSKLSNANSSVLDLNDFEVPVYGIDFEAENGIPESAKKLSELIENSDAIILSLAEHNGSYAAVFKSIFDWMSRINPKVWRNKPMLLMSTSPGGRGGAGVLGSAKMAFPHLGGNIVAEFSLPSFFDNFKEGQLTSKELESELSSAVLNLEEAL
jgi:chromate reductase